MSIYLRPDLKKQQVEEAIKYVEKERDGYLNKTDKFNQKDSLRTNINSSATAVINSMNNILHNPLYDSPSSLKIVLQTKKNKFLMDIQEFFRNTQKYEQCENNVKELNKECTLNINRLSSYK